MRAVFGTEFDAFISTILGGVGGGSSFGGGTGGSLSGGSLGGGEELPS